MKRVRGRVKGASTFCAKKALPLSWREKRRDIYRGIFVRFPIDCISCVWYNELGEQKEKPPNDASHPGAVFINTSERRSVVFP